MKTDILVAVSDRLQLAQDNLRRARSAFRLLSPDDMQREYGESGQTRAEIVAGYEREEARWRKALDLAATLV